MQTSVTKMNENPTKVTVLDLQRSAATYLCFATDEASNAKSPNEDEFPAPSDFDRALIEAAEEMSFNWPEILPVEGIKTGITQIALGSLLFAGLVAVGRFLILSFGS